MRNIRGSPAYWNAAKLDLLGMIKQLGPPTWFLTLSANDMNWFDLLKVLCEAEGLPSSIDSMKTMSKSENNKLMTNNPILTARHFSRRLHHFIHKVLLSDSCPIGKVINYFIALNFKPEGHRCPFTVVD